MGPTSSIERLVGNNQQRRSRTAGVTLTIVASLLFFQSGAEAANEQKCTQLSKNCICSEPMNTATWPGFNGSFFNPADTTSQDKQCRTSGLDAFIEDGAGFRYRTLSSGEAINALPAGHTLKYVLATPEGGGGQFAGTVMRSSEGVPTARRAARWYIYYSPNFVWGNGGADTGGGKCNNSSKLFQLGGRGAGTGGPMLSAHVGTWGFYDISTSLNWNQSAACCQSAPGQDPASPRNAASFLGKWWRYEFILHNAATTGPSTYWEVYAKNVTDNGPEYRVVNASVSQTGVENTWDGTLLTNLHPTSELTDYSINMFRNSLAGDPCPGYYAFTHFLAAAWDTDANQRIGAAVEVEGAPPTPPSGITVTP